MLKFLGLLIIAASIWGGVILSHGQLLALWQPMQFLIIVGGGIGTFFLSNPWYVVRKTTSYLTRSINGTRHYSTDSYQRLLTLLYELFELRRQFGSAVLEIHIENPSNSPLFLASGVLENPRLTQFICDNLRLVTLGRTLPHELEGLLNSELQTMIDDYQRSVTALQGIADALPGFGLITAILGIILAMQTMDSPLVELGVQIASALVGSLLGILLCYGLLNPMARSLNHTIHAEIQLFECVKSSILALVYGRPSAIAVDAGRRMIYSEIRPSFEQMELWLAEHQESFETKA